MKFRELVVIPHYFGFATRFSAAPGLGDFSTISYEKLVWGSDGFRNGLALPLRLVDQPDQIVFFAVELSERAFWDALPDSWRLIPRRVVSLVDIISVWDALWQKLGRPAKFFGNLSSTLLFVERDFSLKYDFRYLPKDDHEVFYRQLMASIDFSGIDRLLFRGIPDSKILDVVASVVPRHVLVDEFRARGLPSGPVYSPEGFLFAGLLSDLHAAFVFDSSLHLTMQIESLCRANVISRPASVFDSLFLDKASGRLIEEQQAWMNLAAEFLNQSGPDFQSRGGQIDSPGFYSQMALLRSLSRDFLSHLSGSD